MELYVCLKDLILFLYRSKFPDFSYLPFFEREVPEGGRVEVWIIRQSKYDKCYFVTTILFIYFAKATDYSIEDI